MYMYMHLIMCIIHVYTMYLLSPELRDAGCVYRVLRYGDHHTTGFTWIHAHVEDGLYPFRCPVQQEDFGRVALISVPSGDEVGYVLSYH